MVLCLHAFLYHLIYHHLFVGCLDGNTEATLVQTLYCRTRANRNRFTNLVNLHTCGNNIWEFDASCLKYEKKIGSGSFSDLWVLYLISSYIFVNMSIHAGLLFGCHRYKGTLGHQNVAINFLKTENLNDDIQREIAQEVCILRFCYAATTSIISIFFLFHSSSLYFFKLCKLSKLDFCMAPTLFTEKWGKSVMILQ